MASIPTSRTRLFNFLSFQLGWFACVVGAGQGWPLAGPAIVVLLLSLQLWLSADPAQNALGIILVTLVGVAVDSLLALAGVFSFAGDLWMVWLCPPWLIALWMIFAGALQNSLSWLVGHYRLAAVLGAVFGPVSYYAGNRLGALVLPFPHLERLLILAAVWSLLFPGLLQLSKVVESTATD